MEAILLSYNISYENYGNKDESRQQRRIIIYVRPYFRIDFRQKIANNKYYTSPFVCKHCSVCCLIIFDLV